MLKTKDLANVTFDAVALWSDILASIAYAVQYSYYSMLQANPGKLFFSWNMFLDINFQPNYKEIWLRNKKLINNNNNKRESTKRVQYNYEVGHYSYILRYVNYK